MADRTIFCIFVLTCSYTFFAARSARLSPKQMINDDSAVGWNGCSKILVIEYDTELGMSVPGPAVTGGSWSYDAWSDVALFDKTESACVKSYRGECAKGGVVVSKDCNGGATTSANETVRCLGGLGCLKATFHWTTLSDGEKLVLKVPTSSGSTCDFEMTSGFVKYYSVNLYDITPRADELADVAAAAAKLSGSSDECGEAAMSIRADAGHAAGTLRDLAVAARDSADASGLTEVQVLNDLMALHFHHRLTTYALDITKAAKITKLHDDLKLLNGAHSWVMHNKEGFPLSGLMKKSSSHGMQALSLYYDSLTMHPVQENSRRALIFTCSFGGGHKSAAKAVADALKKAGFETVVMDTTYDEHFAESGNQMAAHVFNDFVIKRQNYGLFNVMDKLNQLRGPLEKPCPSPRCDTDRKHQFRTAVLKHQPNLIVTVYHMELLPTLEVAKELGNLPVLHVATDMDIKMKELFNHKTVPIYPKFLAGVPFDLDESYDTIAPLTRDQTFLSGYPVRAAFLQPLDEARVAAVAAKKAEFVPEGTKLMVIMTGGGGQDVPWPYKLAEQGIGMPLHIVLIAGGNNEVNGKLKSKLPGEKKFGDRIVMHGADASVTVEVATDPSNTNEEKPYYVFEDHLALLLDMADVVMSKPGGGSTAEIAYRGVPAIFDTSVTLFHWELFTVEVFEKTERGLRFDSATELRKAIPAAIKMGRSQKIAEDKGQLLDTSARVAEAAERLLTMTCVGCKVFKES